MMVAMSLRRRVLGLIMYPLNVETATHWVAVGEECGRRRGGAIANPSADRRARRWACDSLNARISSIWGCAAA